jgi:hypothetical protein
MRQWKRVNPVTEWLCSGAIVFALVGGVPGVVSDAEARPRRQICDQWRDYYYNVTTGAFIEWAGEPYWHCYPADEPASRPDKSPHPDYGGGWGTPRDPSVPTCEQCTNDSDVCNKSVERGGKRCMTHYKDLAHSWCVRYKRKSGDRPLKGHPQCEIFEDPRGKPVEDCHGPAIEDCEESYAANQAGGAIENTMTIEVGPEWLSVGGGRTSSVTWGGSRGYREGCRLAEAEASKICLANLNTCEEAVGGCQ